MRLVALGMTSLLLCTIHYFGIVTFLIILALTWYWQGGWKSHSWATLAVIAIGPVATAVAVVFLLPFQHAATTVSTWVPDPTVAEVVDFGTTLFLPLHLGALAIIAWPSRLTTKAESIADRPMTARIAPSLVSLSGLALLVPVLVLFSYLVQPVLISRYGLPAVAALAPAAAFTVRRISKPWLLVLIVFLIASSAFELRQRAIRVQAADKVRQELIQDIREYTSHDRVLFEAPHQLYIVWRYAPDLRHRVALLDFEKEQLGEGVSRFRLWTRDQARQFNKFYDGPRLVPWTDVRPSKTIYLVPHPDAYAGEPAANERYPQFTMRPVHGELHQLVRNDPP